MELTLYSDKAVDPASISNFRNFKIRHLYLDLDVQFQSKSILGIEILDFTVLKPAAEVVLDVHMLEIKEIQIFHGNVWKPTDFIIKPFVEYGSALHIQIDEKHIKYGFFQVKITFCASSGPGLSWLEPQQTAGKKLPFLYTQGQTVFNRSFFPCQDTPAVKTSYSAHVKVPPHFTAVMSASERSYGVKANLSGDKKCYYFNLPLDIPVYLIALAVGDLKSAKIGPRSQVWAEPCVLDQAKKEFDEIIEDYLQTGEDLFGVYSWEKYDILVMPPSFPFGGMENACLTFITPFLLVGDRSLVFVIMHEIAHSWFGNLVTNATWSDFWLNEGFTTYAQRRIEKTLHGEGLTCLEMLAGQTQMKQLMENQGENHPLHKLRITIEKGVDPEDCYNEVAYEKGCYFVMYLESLAGGTVQFDRFLKSYLKTFQFKSIIAEDMLEFYLKCFPHVKDLNLENRPGFEFSRWLEVPGWPPYEPDLSAASFFTNPAKVLADLLANNDPQATQNNEIKSWHTLQILFYLDQLYEFSLSPQIINELQDFYPFIYQSKNMEIQMRWCLLLIKNKCFDDFSYIKTFLQNQGKIRFTLPIYRTLFLSSDEAKEFAVSVYKTTKPQLHATLCRSIESILF